MKKIFLIRSFTAILTLIISLSSHANNTHDKLSDLSLLPQGADLSLLIKTVEETPETLFAYRKDQFTQPASLQKLITALAAQLELGSDFRFVTRMQTDGKIDAQQLKGDLIIQFSGDPTFTREQLSKMLTELKKQGVDRIKGNIIIDSSIFMGHDKAAGWSWNNLTACYNTAPSATIIDNNCFYAGILPAKKIDEKATTSVADIYPITLTSDIRTTDPLSESFADKYCELDMISLAKNHYYLTGCIKQSDSKSYFKFAVTDSVSYFATILESLLEQKKIIFSGNIIESKKALNTKLTPLVQHQSNTLPVLLQTMLKESNNLIADTLFRTLGSHYYKMPGSWGNGSDAVKAILLNKANIDLTDTVIVDGSGLSRLNLIDANKLMQILQYIAANDESLQLMKMLPISGIDGTLQYRKSIQNKPFKSAIFAKTGYLKGHHNLAGFIKQKDNQYIAFVQLISGYHSTKIESDEQPITVFEKQLFQHFIQ